MQYRVTLETGNTPRAHTVEFAELRRLIRGGAKIIDVQEINLREIEVENKPYRRVKLDMRAHTDDFTPFGLGGW